MKFYATVFLSILLTTSIFPQGIKTQRYNPFSGTIVLTVEGGATLASNDYSGLGVDYLGKIALEYFFPSWIKTGFGIRAFANAGFIKGEDSTLDPIRFRSNITTIGIGVVFTLSIKDELFPYLFAGFGSLSFDPKGDGGVKLPNNEEGTYNTTEINYIGELGVRYPVTENLSVNGNIGIQISPNDWLDDKAIGTSNDMFFTAMTGISYSFLTDFDSDGDGVIDSKDACANTPPGIKVDEFGCPIDNDNDGVADYLDECPGTPKGASVDSKGCPLDSDRDGVPDYTDLCPNTLIGIKVDDYGCAFDNDADGVPDYLDRCPGTPYNISVDDKGCPMDSDLDGVPDHIDQCPGTLPGVQVDEKGCEKEIVPVPVPLPETEEEVDDVNEVTLSSEASFEFNSAQLKSSAYPYLDKVLSEMKKFPLSRWKIEGHTDNIGNDEGNLKISKLRAESVLNYFVSRGIPQGRFEVVGLGSKNPIADNATEKGRAKNRRVVITRVR